MSTYLSLKYHIIFSTKNRTPYIEDSWMPRLHSYLAGTLTGLGGIPLATGGTSDHVHMLCALKQTITIADVVRKIKVASSSWAHDDLQKKLFGWQDGYAAFSVSHGNLERVRHYIATQRQHHRDIGSKEELLAICAEEGVEIDMRYFS